MTKLAKPAQNYPIPTDETQRLAALAEYVVVDTPPEPEFDHIAELAADLFDVPIALISYVEKDRQFYKARVGFEACDSSRDVSFCTHVLVCDDVMVIPDARVDPRFKNNPYVIGEPFIRFYAGAPLITAEGHRIGSICVIDPEPRPRLNEHEKGILKKLATLSMDQLERRRIAILKQAFLRMAAATSDAIVCSNEDGLMTFWNTAAEGMFGYSANDVLGQPLEIIIPEFRATIRAEREAAHWTPERSSLGKAIEITGVRQDKTLFPAELSLTFWNDGEGRQFGAIIRDVSERHRAQEHMRYLTHFDRLTALPNRVRFIEVIEDELRGASIFCVLKVGLDRFKMINSSIGMAGGDAVLRATAERIVRTAGPDAFVGRIGADEFGVLLRSKDSHHAKSVGDQILAAMSEPFHVHGSISHVGASIGIASCSGPLHFENADAVLKCSMLALLHAKKTGGRRVELYRPQLSQQAEERRHLEDELRLAFARREFELYFQPQVRVGTRDIVGAEALLRWNHPERGLLLPSAFLSTLESSEIAVDVGLWIINAACAFAVELVLSGHMIRMGVNLFAAQLRAENLDIMVGTALSTHRLPANLLELEITETTILGLHDGVIESLRNLRKRGVSIAFDDYGTGYASLSLLKRYPLTRLKIDVEFVKGLLTDPDDAAIVRAVLALGRSMGFHVIAEGVETSQQLAKLIDFGCEEVQGYLFGKPMPAAQFLKLLKKGAASEAA
ncbi:sensor domain-containing phosphodiesterase [Methyloferula stellata]|uniref:sensor domain-containing phosphodiesterase n=1 Tax=Methyloferula stellata TaxID=876270 RepID=UPI0003AA1F8E|nr:EAL domain-containing protein [Methyloferula stellata]